MHYFRTFKKNKQAKTDKFRICKLMVSQETVWGVGVGGVFFTFDKSLSHYITGDSELKETKQMQFPFFFPKIKFIYCVAFNKM